MEPISLLVGVAIPIAAAGAKYLLDWLWRDRTKEMAVRLGGGRFENITVAANADSTQIIRALQSELKFEQLIHEVLREYALQNLNFQQRQGKQVDFVAQLDGKKVAIEVKNRIDRITPSQINRYLAEEPGLSRLLLLSPEAPSPSVLAATKELLKEGRVSFVQIPDTNDVKRRVYEALERAAGRPLA